MAFALPSLVSLGSLEIQKERNTLTMVTTRKPQEKFGVVSATTIKGESGIITWCLECV